MKFVPTVVVMLCCVPVILLAVGLLASVIAVNWVLWQVRGAFDWAVRR